MISKNTVTACLLGLALAGPAAFAQQEQWPQRAISIVVPSAPGGAADLTARTLAHYLNQKHGMNVVVEDKPGAGGIIGTAAVRNAKPDGYSFLLSTNSTQAANQFLYKSLPYDAQKDFVDVGLIGKFGTVAVVSPDSEVKVLKDLADKASAAPGKVFFGYYSSSSQVPSALFREYADIKIEGAAYKNITQILTDLRGRLIDFAFVDYLTAMGQISGGNLKPVAVTGQDRSPAWPDVATTGEDYPGFVVEGWLGISAPAGTPDEIVRRMNALIAEAVADPATKEQYEKLGMQPQSMAVDEFQAFVREDVQRWKGWIDTAGIQPQ
ncbi:Bug family tripartite tricarboxylate transporter substrate binding protein [Paracandidimonas soli]|uniref:Bug family tripartite tricarboxylate transporter substrate binding protein n=1 Tax=Paracandidimonas soli TaxID=1917182 RepID=UPI00333FDBBF